jgi:hypothetical protein
VGVYRQVCYFIGSFKGKPARMAAIYGFPEGAKGKVPGVMHIHGGVQRASLSEVKLLVGRGYAALWNGGSAEFVWLGWERGVAGVGVLAISAGYTTKNQLWCHG